MDISVEVKGGGSLGGGMYVILPVNVLSFGGRGGGGGNEKVGEVECKRKVGVKWGRVEGGGR